MPTSGAAPRRRGRAGPSMADVAQVAGVSTQTVSRVSMGLDNVRPQTRDKVLAAMAELGYSANVAARALRYGRFGALGVIAHRMSRTGESRTVEAVIEAARSEGYTVSLIDLESPSSQDVTEAVQRLTHQAIDGLIIIRAETASPDTVALPGRMPVVVSDSRFVGHHPAVGADQTAGATMATRHLLDLGHRTVHHLAGPEDSAPAQMRAQAWQAALERAGREVPPVHRGDWTAQTGYDLGRQIARDPQVTAVFCANDESAAGLVRALHEAGRRVPEDVSVVGFDGIPLAEFLWPPLTTVVQDFTGIGRGLVDLVLQQVRDGAPHDDEHHLVPVRLAVRASSGPAPR